MVLNTLHPFVLYSYLLSDMLHPREKQPPIPRMDVELERLTEALNKENYFLETVPEQLNLLTQQPLDTWLQQLQELATPQGRESTRNKTNRLLSVCITGDDARFLKDQQQTMTAKDAALLTERNYRWLPKIEQHLSEDSTFIAVGAAHIYGTEGILQLLKTKGWSVQRVSR